jgi:C-terminal processing protease CtpA/Prc
MRKLSACLVAGMLATIPASAVAGPDQTDTREPWHRAERFEWSTSQARLGVMVMAMTPELRQYFGAPNAHGVLVAKVEPDSAAAKAGIEVGDVIVNVKGESVDDARDVLEALSTAKQGDKVEVQIVRARKQVSIEATIGKRAMTSSSLQSLLREAMPWLDFSKWRSSSTLGSSTST